MKNYGTLLLSDFEVEAKYTRSLLAACPEEHFSWKPHEKSMSLGELASHLAENPIWAKSMMQGDLDFAAPEMADYVPYAAEGGIDLLTAFERNVADFQALLSDRTDAELEVTWNMRHGDKLLMSEPRHAALRSIVIHHQAHHRGQLTVYLRLLDIAVPPTYGPTADVQGGV